MSKKVEQRAQELVEKYISKELELVDVDYVKENGEYYLRILIDKEGGVSLDDCEALSRAIDDKLDEADIIPDAYYLEVSSPGLDRELKKEKDFIREKGKKILVKLYKNSELGKEFTGVLEGLDEDKNLLINIDGKSHTIEKKDIAKINLQDFDF